MFFFQMSYIPEFVTRLEDMKLLRNSFTGKKLGAKPGTFTDEDIEMYKYVFRNFGELIPC
jgi:hypothetical protein